LGDSQFVTELDNKDNRLAFNIISMVSVI